MKTLRIAFRNIFRNSRRSLMTIFAIGVSAVAVHLFGGYVTQITYGMQSDFVRDTGHLHIYKKGFFDFGDGNPGAYGISHYHDLIRMITHDSQLKDFVVIATPIIKLYGIAGNFEKDVSKTFFGIGYVPSDIEKMYKWNDYGLPGRASRWNRVMLPDADIEGGVIGEGMARMLLLCDVLSIENCASGIQKESEKQPIAIEDFSYLVNQEESSNSDAENIDKRPRIDLLSATASGAPNVLSFYVNNTEIQAVKALDDNYIGMNISLAQRLLYGSGEKKVTGVIVQLGRTKDIPFTKARLQQLFDKNKLDLEIKDYTQIIPMYKQTISFLYAIFGFIASIMGIIVLFTIVNTMTMNVMERVDEIGTIRALGLRRAGILRQFIAEGFLLGVLGATFGSVASVIIAAMINASGMSYIPPNYVDPVPLAIVLFKNPFVMPGLWMVFVHLSVVSSIFPAIKAGRMVIVDALRHV